MSFTLKASCRPVAVMASCRPIAAAGPARRVAPSAARLAPLRPASALKNASLTGLCSSFAGEEKTASRTRVGFACAPSPFFFFIGTAHDECEMRTPDVDGTSPAMLARVPIVDESCSFATATAAAEKNVDGEKPSRPTNSRRLELRVAPACGPFSPRKILLSTTIYVRKRYLYRKGAWWSNARRIPCEADSTRAQAGGGRYHERFFLLRIFSISPSFFLLLFTTTDLNSEPQNKKTPGVSLAPARRPATSASPSTTARTPLTVEANAKTCLGCTKRGTRRRATRTSGFRARMATPTGRGVLKARRKKGRKVLCTKTLYKK